jgi:hypothetical protein
MSAKKVPWAWPEAPATSYFFEEQAVLKVPKTIRICRQGELIVKLASWHGSDWNKAGARCYYIAKNTAISRFVVLDFWSLKFFL